MNDIFHHFLAPFLGNLESTFTRSEKVDKPVVHDSLYFWAPDPPLHVLSFHLMLASGRHAQDVGGFLLFLEGIKIFHWENRDQCRCRFHEEIQQPVKVKSCEKTWKVMLEETALICERVSPKGFRELLKSENRFWRTLCTLLNSFLDSFHHWITNWMCQGI